MERKPVFETKWIEVYDKGKWEKAKELARGSYQSNFLDGLEAYSGSTLRGKAKEYGGRYKCSLDNLCARMSKAGIANHIAVGPHGRNILVIR